MFQNIRPTRWAYAHFLFLLFLLFLSVLFSDSHHPLRLKLQNGVFDQFNVLHPREPSGQVTIIDIDEASLEHLGQWPWPRNIMADLIESLSKKGAKVIAFDGVFSEEDRSSPHYFLQNLSEAQRLLFPKMKELSLNDPKYNYDMDFANEIKSSERFITAFTYGRKDRTNNSPLNQNRILARSDVKNKFLEHASYFEAAAVNLPEFSNNAAGNGSFMAKPDADGILRRVGMIFSDKKRLYPSLSLEALRVARLGRKGAVRLGAVPDDKRKDVDTNYRILVDDLTIPVEDDGILYVRYRHFCTKSDVVKRQKGCISSDYLSAYKLLDKSYEQEVSSVVKDKIVLIGASAEGLKDLRSTALQPFRPGVEVHANVIEQVLTGEYLLRPSITKGVEASFIFAAGLLFIVFAPFIGVVVSLTLCAGIIGLAIFGAYFVYVDYGLLVDPIYPSLSVLIIFIASTILSYARAEAKRKQIRNAFGMYVATDVMRDLERNPEKLTLGGENKNLTVMFTDIRKFTSISEGLSPEELIQLMNEFLTGMTDIVMEHHGTVDKYIGDAMMAFWNAPKDLENHQKEACLAALKMQSCLDPINEKISKRAADRGKTPILLNAGIGLNSGLCAVGNMGSRQRFAYSALGDAVNVAARLESQTKTYKTNILIGESVFEEVRDLASLELDFVKVAGRDKAERVYALLGDESKAKEESFKKWKGAHENMLDCYRNQKFDEALEAIAKCCSVSDDSQVPLYEMYKQRIHKLKKEKLPEDWDGVYTADTK